jgi:hypothetical protein
VAPAKNRPDKSKRYRQNKAQRETRAARSARAGEATAIARGEREATTAPARATEPDAGRSGTTKAAGKRKSPWTIPGQRAVVLAFMFSIVSAATLLLAPIQVPVEVDADDPRVEEGDEPDDDGMVTIYEDGKLVEEETAAVAAVVLLAPIAITGAAVWFTKRPQRATAWTMAMLAMAAYVFFVGSYGVIALPALIALAVGGFQLRRSESKERVAEIKANRAARKAAKGEVIDVDAVEDADALDGSDVDAPDQR